MIRKLSFRNYQISKVIILQVYYWYRNFKTEFWNWTCNLNFTQISKYVVNWRLINVLINFMSAKSFKLEKLKATNDISNNQLNLQKIIWPLNKEIVLTKSLHVLNHSLKISRSQLDSTESSELCLRKQLTRIKQRMKQRWSMEKQMFFCSQKFDYELMSSSRIITMLSNPNRQLL